MRRVRETSAVALVRRRVAAIASLDRVGVGVHIRRCADDPFSVRLGSRESRGLAPLAQDDDPIAHADELGQLRRNEQDCESLRGELGDHRMDLGLALDVDALGRLVENHEPRIGGEPFGQHDLLLVAARKRLYGLVEIAELQSQSLQVRLDKGELASSPDQTGERRPVDRRQRGIGEDREIHDEALAEPVLRHVGYSPRHGVGRIREGRRLAGEPNLAGCRPVDAEQDAGHLGAAAPDQAAQADHLARAHGEGDVGEGAVTRKARGLEDDRSRRRSPLRIDRAQGSADHHLHGLVAVDLSGRSRADQPSVAQHGDAARDAINLLHAVADEHHRDAVGLKARHHPEQPLDLALRKCGGRLIHDQDPGVDGQRAGDLDQLLLRRSQLLQETFRAAGEADDVEQLGSPPAHALPIHAAEPGSRHMAEIDVLANAEVAEEARMLVHHRDAGAGGVKRRPALRRAPVDQNGSAVGLVHAREELDAGALARAVLTEEREHLSRNEIEGHVANCDHATEPLRGRREPGRRLGPRRNGAAARQSRGHCGSAQSGFASLDDGIPLRPSLEKAAMAADSPDIAIPLPIDLRSIGRRSTELRHAARNLEIARCTLRMQALGRKAGEGSMARMRHSSHWSTAWPTS